MNNVAKFAIIGMILAMVVVGVLMVLRSDKEEVVVDTAMESKDVETKEKPVVVQQDDMQQEIVVEEIIEEKEEMVQDAQSGKYVLYSQDLLKSTEGGAAVLFFKADWCSTCVALDKDIVANSHDIPETLTIFEVDYDKETELRKKYGVTIQHTLVQVDQEGNMITKWTGSPDLSTLVKKVQ